MREVQASEEKTHLPSLLDAVERGETIVITRHGKPIARIVPEADHRRAELDRVFAEIEELRKKLGRLGSVNLDALQELTELEARAAALARVHPYRAAKIGRQVRRLISSSQMGQLFQVAAIAAPGLTPPGFE